MQYFFTEIKGDKIIDPRVVHQIGRVLRGRTGDQFFILDGKGGKELVEATGFTKKAILIKKINLEKLENNKQKINLFFGLPKSKEKFEFILQKGTELGVTRFIPLKTDFFQAKYGMKEERNSLILTESSEQSERIFIPEISEITEFKDIFNGSGEFYFFDPRAKDLKTQFDLLEEISAQKEINLIIGPEGGFSEDEVDFAKEKGAQSLSLGTQILRLETAIIVALSRLK